MRLKVERAELMLARTEGLPNVPELSGTALLGEERLSLLLSEPFPPNPLGLPKILRQSLDVMLNRCSSVKCSRRNL